MEIRSPVDINNLFPVRKSKKQKAAFHEAIRSYLSQYGYDAQIESGSFGARNIVFGDPERAKYLITAHYDTCARMLVPNLCTPCNLWLFLLYQIFVTILIMLPGIVPWVLLGLFADAYLPGYFVWLVITLGLCAMVMVGPANRHNANDNTSGVVTVLEIARSLPEKMREDVCFVLFDLEEAGLIGSSSYRSKHKKASDKQIVLNLDCVGEGDEIYFFPTSRLKKDVRKNVAFDKICGTYGKKSIHFRRRGISVYPSDQAQFPYGVGICALKRNRMGLYLSRIHTPDDTILDETNVNILRAALISLIDTAAE